MELREVQAKLLAQKNAVIKENKELKRQVEELTRKQANDCDTIIKQVKELQSLSHSERRAKTTCKKLHKNLKKATKLFDTMLNVKLQYEEVIKQLTLNPVTCATTLELVKSTKN